MHTSIRHLPSEEATHESRRWRFTRPGSAAWSRSPCAAVRSTATWPRCSKRGARRATSASFDRGRARRASTVLRRQADRDRGSAGTIARQVRPAVVVALVALVACNSSTPPVANSSGASGSRVPVAAPDFYDQASFSDRTGRLPVLSLQSLFHPTYVVPHDPSRIRTLLVTGDVIPARGVNYYATARHDFLWPFRPTADYAKSADVTYINLETPLFAGCPVVATATFTFCGDARFIDGLTLMGAKVANLANNHLS